jgi:hypothetical protein
MGWRDPNFEGVLELGVGGGGTEDASTKRPLPVLILPFTTPLNDFIPDNHEFLVKTTLV